MSSASPPSGDARRPDGQTTGPRWNAWNLLLLLPLLMLVVPWFNKDHPRLGGLPFFYWYQFLFVVVGVGSVWIVYATTRNRSSRAGRPDSVSTDGVDEEGGR